MTIKVSSNILMGDNVLVIKGDRFRTCKNEIFSDLDTELNDKYKYILL